ncbi:unnamed protein product [Urochloa humidicola]
MGIPWRRQHGEWQRRPRFACWALAFRSRGSPLHLRLRLEAVVLPHRSPPDGPTMVARRTDGRWTPDLANLTSSLECGHIRSLTSHMNKFVYFLQKRLITEELLPWHGSHSRGFFAEKIEVLDD